MGGVQYNRPWRGGKAQSVGHISAGGAGRRGGFGVKPQTSRAIATAATGVDSLGQGSSGTGELGRTMTNEAPDSIKEQAQSYYHSKLTQQQAKSLTATAAMANKTVIENKSKGCSPKTMVNGKVKLRSAGHNLFRPPANKPTFQKTTAMTTTTTNKQQSSSAAAEEGKSPTRGAVLKTAKTAVSYRLKKQPLAYKIAASTNLITKSPVSKANANTT